MKPKFSDYIKKRTIDLSEIVLKGILFIFLLIFPAKFSVGQQVSDSLLLKNLALVCDTISSGDTATGNRICRELLQVAGTTTDSLTKAEAFRLAGNCSGKLGNFGEAFSQLDQAAESARKIETGKGRITLAKSLVNTGAICHVNGDFNAALNYYLEAEKLFFIEHEISWLIRVYASLGDLYDKISQPEKRKEINEKAFSLLSETTDTEAQIKAYTCKANNLSNENKFDEAIEMYNKTVALAQSVKNRHLEHVAFYNLGFVYSRMDKYTEAADFYLKSYDAAKISGNRSDMGDALYKIGLMNYYSENLSQSRKYLFEAMQIADELQSNILKRNIYDVLYSVEETDGNFKKAYEYLNNYVDVEFEIFSEEDQRQTNFLKARFDAEKREFQIKQLESEKQIQVLKVKKQGLYIFILLLFLSLAATIILLLQRRHRHKQQLAAKQAEIHQQKIQQLEKERQLVAVQSVLQGEEAERSRMATDLHDGLGGLLSGVKINLSSMKEHTILTEKQVHEFNHALELLDNSIGELRRIAHNMMPETLLKYGLKTALNDFCTELSHEKTKVNFNFFGEELRYTSELELTLYRIGQELVNNALKHAEASQINIQLFAELNRLSLQVFDNGKGFNVEEIENSTKAKGLQNIRNRVSAFEGTIEIVSQPGQGTEFLIEFKPE